jgi:hypothetical protein
MSSLPSDEGGRGKPPVPNHLALSLIELTAMGALQHMDRLKIDLTAHAANLPTNPLEFAALAERVNAVTDELGWIREYLTKLGKRVEQAEQERGGLASRAAPDAMSRRALFKTWPGKLPARPTDRPGHSGDDRAGPV